VTLARAGAVAAIDAAADSIVATLPVGKRAAGLAVTANGARLWVAVGALHEVTVVDAATFRPARRIAVGSEPWGVTLSR